MTAGRTARPARGAAARYDASFDTAWGAHAWLGPALEALRRLAPGVGAFQLLTVQLPGGAR
jgi:hypothetical protein